MKIKCFSLVFAKLNINGRKTTFVFCNSLYDYHGQRSSYDTVICCASSKPATATNRPCRQHDCRGTCNRHPYIFELRIGSSTIRSGSGGGLVPSEGAGGAAS